MMTFDDAHGAVELITDRRSGERRTVTAECRESAATTAVGEVDRREEGGGRRKVERRRQIDPTTCERDYSEEEIVFMSAMNDYKRRSGRQFPTWSEVLEVLESLGYRKVEEPVELKL